MLTWEDVDKLVDHLIPQFEGEFTAMVMITKGGIVPGGLLAEAMGLTHILTAAVDFPAEEAVSQKGTDRLLIWPQFLQFPEASLLRSRRTLVLDDVWGSGRTITAVKNRVSAAGGFPFTCVFHFNPYRNLFGSTRARIITPPSPMHLSSIPGRWTAGQIKRCWMNLTPMSADPP